MGTVRHGTERGSRAVEGGIIISIPTVPLRPAVILDWHHGASRLGHPFRPNLLLAGLFGETPEVSQRFGMGRVVGDNLTEAPSDLAWS